MLVLLTACGGGGSGGALSIDPVAQAADRTISAGTSKVKLNMTIHDGAKTISMPGSGVFDNKNGDGELTFDMSAITSKLGDQASGTEMVEVFTGGVIFLKLPFKGLPPGKSWIKFDPTAMAQYMGLQVTPAGDQTPAKTLRTLKAGKDVRKLGAGAVDGVHVDGYAVTVTEQDLLDQAQPGKRERLKTMLDQAKGVYPQTTRIWIDPKTKLIRKLSMNMGTTVDMSMLFYDFGTPLELHPPAQDQVMDGLDFLKQAQGG
ncbi:MAG: hypothetical protein QOE36_2485 [Gaiellaceae bacterium]|nr:hypothetical protein [Gaiellaceae bacterium]